MSFFLQYLSQHLEKELLQAIMFIIKHFKGKSQFEQPHWDLPESVGETKLWKTNFSDSFWWILAKMTNNIKVNIFI